jgi:hypothetical protein
MRYPVEKDPGMEQAIVGAGMFQAPVAGLFSVEKPPPRREFRVPGDPLQGRNVFIL